MLSVILAGKPVYVIVGKMSCAPDLEFTEGLMSKCVLYFPSRRDEITGFQFGLKDFVLKATFNTLLSPQKCQNQTARVTTSYSCSK